ALSQESGEPWRFDAATRTATSRLGDRMIMVKAERAPLLVTGHDSIEALRAEYETKGYWYLASRASEAGILALRFNLDEAPENRFWVAIADRNNEAKVQSSKPPPPLKSQGAALEAVRDVMGWNGV